MHQEFKKATVAARANQTRSIDKAVGSEVTIRMHGCDVIASTNARYFYIKAEVKSAMWIQSGLRSSVKAYIDRELRAMSHTLSTGVDEPNAIMLNLRPGVREKIMWKPEKFKWDIKFKGDIGSDVAFCKKNQIYLTVDKSLISDEFMAAREEAFINAMHVWNAVDKSGRLRIKIPERRLHLQMQVPFPKCEAMSHTESEAESEQDEAAD